MARRGGENRAFTSPHGRDLLYARLVLEAMCNDTTEAGKRFAAGNLKFIANAGLERQLRGWHIWTTDWWTEREHAALGSLEALRKAMDVRFDSRWSGR